MQWSFLRFGNHKIRLWVSGSVTAAGAVGLAVASLHAGPEWLRTTGAIALTFGGVALATELYVRIKERGLERRAARPEPPLVPGWNVPLPIPSFSEREEVLRGLRQDFTQHRVVALTGIAGVGKTQIARGYAYAHEFDYDHAFWVSAATPAVLVTGYTEIQRLLGLGMEEVADQGQIVAAVRDALGGRDRWLLIFDDVENPELVQEFFPAGAGGHILLTMETVPVPEIALARPVAAMSAPEDARLLQQRAGRLSEPQELTDATPADQADTRALSAAVGGLPLALDLAGASMVQFGLTPGEYRERYATAAQRRGPADGDAAAPDAVETTFSLACERLPRETASLLRVCAFLAPDGIPEALFTRDAPDGDAAIRAATRLALLQRDAERRSLAVHRRVQAALRERMSAEDQSLWLERAVRTVYGAFSSDEAENWPWWDRLLPHALSCAHWIATGDLVFLDAARLLCRVGWYLWTREQHAAAEPLFQRALAIYEQVLGAKHSETAWSLHGLAGVYRDQGKLAEAEPLLQRALAIYEEMLGPKHPNVACILYSLAVLYDDQGKPAEAALLYQRVLAIQEKALGRRHHDTATTLYSLGRHYVVQRKWREAKPLLERALAIFEKVLGSEHPDTARCLHHLATLYRNQGRLKEAEARCRRALVIKEQALGPKHPDTANSRSNLAALYYLQGKLTEAEPLYQRALAIREEHLGPKHRDTASSLHNLGMLYAEHGRLAEAEPLLQRALAIRQEVLGDPHPETASSLDGLATLYRTQGKLTEVEPLCRQALAIREEWRPRHPDTARSLEGLALLYRAQGRLAEAAPLLQRALAIFTEVLGSEHPDTQTCQAHDTTVRAELQAQERQQKP